MPTYPIGKLSHEELTKLLATLPGRRARDVLVGPAVGEDAAAVAMGDRVLVVATDPVTFAADRAGWYAVQVNANDVATMGARPRWFQACVLMPSEGSASVESVFEDIGEACRAMSIAVLGGHTEVTAGLRHPIVIGTMMGHVERDSLVTSGRAKVGDTIVLTKTAAIEATAIVAFECADRLRGTVARRTLKRAERFLDEPGISVVREGLCAARAGASAMHDPTEGGVLTGLWEMATASDKRFEIDTEAIPVATETRQLCEVTGLDPLRALASGCLLITIARDRTKELHRRLKKLNIAATTIGSVSRGSAGLFDRTDEKIPVSATDEIAKLFQ